MSGNLKPANRAGEPLMPLADLDSPGAKGFSLGEGAHCIDIFLVRDVEGAVTAFRNACPHVGSPLDWMPDQFLNMDQDLIQCATHDALFRPGDGVCVSGPCVGQALTAVAVEINEGIIVLREAVK